MMTKKLTNFLDALETELSNAKKEQEAQVKQHIHVFTYIDEKFAAKTNVEDFVAALNNANQRFTSEFKTAIQYNPKPAPADIEKIPSSYDLTLQKILAAKKRSDEVTTIKEKTVQEILREYESTYLAIIKARNPEIILEKFENKLDSQKHKPKGLHILFTDLQDNYVRGIAGMCSQYAVLGIRTENPTEYATTLLHEIGHCLGLLHSKGHNNIMSSRIEPECNSKPAKWDRGSKKEIAKAIKEYIHQANC
jgi:hypothetical protein